MTSPEMISGAEFPCGSTPAAIDTVMMDFGDENDAEQQDAEQRSGLT